MSFRNQLMKKLYESRILKVDTDDNIKGMNIEEIIPKQLYKIPITGTIVEFNKVDNDIYDVYITLPHAKSEKKATCFHLAGNWICKSEYSKEDYISDNMLQSAIGVLSADGLV